MVQEIKKRKGSGTYPRGGWVVKPAEDRKVMVYGYVPRRHYKEVQSKITELLKQYR